MEAVTVLKGHFRRKEEAIQELMNAGWWPISLRDAPGEIFEPHKPFSGPARVVTLHGDDFTF